MKYAASKRTEEALFSPTAGNFDAPHLRKRETTQHTWQAFAVCTIPHSHREPLSTCMNIICFSFLFLNNLEEEEEERKSKSVNLYYSLCNVYKYLKINR